VLGLVREVNPDEALTIASARGALAHPIPWLGFDGGTIGPINVGALAWLQALGLPATYQAERILELVLQIAVALTCYVLVRLAVGEVAARVSTFLVSGFFATTSASPDFIFYSSETLPTLLLLFAATAVVAARANRKVALVAVSAAGFLIGVVPFAKLQLAPTAAAVAAIVFASLAVKQDDLRQRRIFTLGFGCGIITAASAVLLPVIASGSWRDFLTSYVLQGLAYVRATPHSWATGGLDLRLAPALFVFVLSAALLILMNLGVWIREGWARRPDEGRPWLFAAAIASVAAVVTFCAILPHEPFAHHFLPLVPLLAIFAGTITSIAFDSAPTLARDVTVLGIAGYLFCGAFLSTRVDAPYMAMIIDPSSPVYYWDEPTVEISELLSRVAPGEAIAVWGWSPEVYVATGATEGTREAETQFQMWPGPYQSYYIARYIGDLEARHPKYFLDAVRDIPVNPPLTTPGDRHDRYPSVAAYVASRYRLIAQLGGRRLYVRTR
jgi:hypothetical protein